MPSGGGSPVQITHHGGFAAFESTDGRFLYYAKGLTVPGLWRVPTNGGEEVEQRFEKWGEFKGLAFWFWDWAYNQ